MARQADTNTIPDLGILCSKKGHECWFLRRRHTFRRCGVEA